MNIKKGIDDNLRVMMYMFPIVSIILIIVFGVKLCNPPINKNKIIPINEKFNHLNESNIKKIEISLYPITTIVSKHRVIITNKKAINEFKNCLKLSKGIERSVARYENIYGITLYLEDSTSFNFFYKYKLLSWESCPECMKAGAEEDNQVYLFDYPLENIRDEPSNIYRVGYYCNNELLKFIKQYVEPYKNRNVYEIK